MEGKALIVSLIKTTFPALRSLLVPNVPTPACFLKATVEASIVTVTNEQYTRKPGWLKRRQLPSVLGDLGDISSTV